MKKLTLITFLILLMGTSNLMAQDFKSIEDLKRRFFERVLPIKGESNQVEGYVVYYMSEKQKKGVRTFAVQSYDINLNEVALSTLDITKNTNILSTAFNGQNLCVILGDSWKRTLKAVTYNRKGEKQGESNWTVKKWYETSASVYPSQTGFYFLRILRDKKTGFELSHSNNFLEQQWKKKFVPEKGYEGLLLASNIEDKLVFIKEKGASLSRKLTVELVTVNEKDGSIEGRFDLFDGKNTYIPSSFRFDKEKNIILGGMYFEGEKYRDINSKGVFVMKTKVDGKDKSKTSLPWKGEMQKYLAQSKTKGLRLDGKNKILFEDILIHSDGIQLIGETFSRALITLLQIPDVQIGTRRDNEDKPVRFNIKDIMIFNFNNDLKFTNVQIIPKKEVNISCYSPYDSMYGMQLAKTLQRLGYFNYRFSMKETSESQAFTIISTNQGDLLDSFKKGVRYSITKVTPKKLVLQETLQNIKFYNEQSRIRSCGLLPNTGDRLLIFYYDPKFDAVRLYLDEIGDLK